MGALLVVILALCGAGALLPLAVDNREHQRILGWFGALASAVLLCFSGASLFADVPFTRRCGAFLRSRRSHCPRTSSPRWFFLFPAWYCSPVRFSPPAISIGTLAVTVSGLSAYPYFALFITLVLIPLSADAISFLMLWELMSILIYLLVNYEDEVEEHTRAGYLMLAIGEAGTLLIALAFIVLANNGALEFTAMKIAGGALNEYARWAVFLLAFFGFGVKAGLLPVNFWLPQAYTSAPEAFVPVLAGVTLNLGIYGIVRLNGDLLPVAMVGPGLVALIIGSVTALLGILYATTQSDLKTLLAHSSIENAGIITAALGAGFIFIASGHLSARGNRLRRGFLPHG